jgi:thioredoxin reductase
MGDLLRNGFDAVLLAVGRQSSLTLDVEGEDLEGVVKGLDFLREVNEEEPVDVSEPVVVIGGGNVAVDVARCARRLGAADVRIVCLERREEMPAHEREISEALEEGVKLHNSFGPRRILGEAGAVVGIELMRCTSVFDAQSRFAPSYDQENLQTMEAGIVVCAIGQLCDMSCISEDDVEVVSEKKFIGAGSTGATAVEGVFVCGDAAGDCANVIEAIASARKAAEEIDGFLGGDGRLDETLAAEFEREEKIGRMEDFLDRQRNVEPTATSKDRVCDFRPIVTPYGEEFARREAERCLQCDLRLSFSPVVLPPDLWQEFTREAVESAPESAGVYQLADENRKVTAIKGVDNLRDALLGIVDSFEPGMNFLWEEDPMFTKRESELIQQHLKQFGEMPGGEPGEEDLDDLF